MILRRLGIGLIHTYQAYAKSYARYHSRKMDLKAVTNALNKMAPLKLAADWDNVGLLVEPSLPHKVKRIMLTNDLTEKVMQESIDTNVDLIVSYHPPLFKPLKRITQKNWKERIVILAIENRIAIYSPHTACDAVRNGVNDWLASGLGKLKSIQPVEFSVEKPSENLLTIIIEDKDEIACNVEATLNKKFKSFQKEIKCNIIEIQLICSYSEVISILKDMDSLTHGNHKFHISNLSPSPLLHTGMGRICHLAETSNLEDIIKKLKKHLSLNHLRIARGCSMNDKVETVALCAGSGSSVLRNVDADVYLTGEMSHHEVLDAVSNNTTVILCEHSNTERGYLNKFKELLQTELQNENVKILISIVDEEPVKVC